MYKDKKKQREYDRNRCKLYYKNHRGDNKHFCCEDISLIENYELAKADDFVGWDLHHRFEIGSFYTLSVAELKALDLYHKRPASELIYLQHSEHTVLHNQHRQ